MQQGKNIYAPYTLLLTTYVSYYSLISLTICLKNYRLAIDNLMRKNFDIPNFFNSYKGVHVKYAIFDAFVHLTMVPTESKRTLIEILTYNKIINDLQDKILFDVFIRIFIEFVQITANQEQPNFYKGVELTGDKIRYNMVLDALSDSSDFYPTWHAESQSLVGTHTLGIYKNICQKATGLPFINCLSEEMLTHADIFFNHYMSASPIKPSENDIFDIFYEVRKNLQSEVLISIRSSMSSSEDEDNMNNKVDLAIYVIDAVIKGVAISEVQLDPLFMDFDNEFYQPYAEYVSDIIANSDKIANTKRITQNNETRSKLLWYWYLLRDVIIAYDTIHKKFIEIGYELCFKELYSMVFRNVDLSFLEYDYSQEHSVYNSITLKKELDEVLDDMLDHPDNKKFTSGKLNLMNRIQYKYYFDYKIPLTYTDKRVDVRKINLYHPLYIPSDEEKELINDVGYISSFLKANLFYIPFLVYNKLPDEATYKEFFRILSLCDNLTSVVSFYSSYRKAKKCL